MRLAFVCALLLGGCPQSTQKHCMSVGGPSGLVTDAEMLRLDIYADTVACDGNQVPPGSQPILSRTFSPGEEIKLDIPPGMRTLVLTTFGAGGVATGSGCTTSELKPGAQLCVSLTLTPVLDLSVPIDLAGDFAMCTGAGCVCTTNPDSCPAGQFCDGTMCQVGCKEASDCVGVGPVGDGGTPRTVCNTGTHQCVECAGNNDCPLGKLCSPSGVCTVGCDASHACPGSQTCCNSLCVDTSSDPAHCGMCNNPCNAGSATSCCASVCTDVNTSVDHCGACGRACSTFAVANRQCTIGKCTSSCTFGNGNCAQPAAPTADDGCETLVNTTLNCGVCGRKCDGAAGHGTPTCDLPDAGVSSCKWACANPFKNCDSTAPDVDGCETDSSSDKLNCGACFNTCSTSGATATNCVGSVCTPTCDSTHHNCNSNAANNDGCEVTSSTTNCTACATGCGALPQNGASWSCPSKS